ncbi:MAG: hypothetical protein RRA94_15420, partial [Bacteroidota bacterium]|nr:hypothetical protein [Bacteroidota bacterium]
MDVLADEAVEGKPIVIAVVTTEMYIMFMDRKHTRLSRLSDSLPEDRIGGTAEERINQVWLLTLELASLNKDFDAERRLQRHVTH